MGTISNSTLLSTCDSGEDVTQKYHNISEAHNKPTRYVELREETREAHGHYRFVQDAPEVLGRPISDDVVLAFA